MKVKFREHIELLEPVTVWVMFPMVQEADVIDACKADVATVIIKGA